MPSQIACQEHACAGGQAIRKHHRVYATRQCLFASYGAQYRRIVDSGRQRQSSGCMDWRAIGWIRSQSACADAVGLVFYAKSARYVSPVMAAELMREVPSFVSTVGLFVNATAQEVTDAVAIAPISLLQFHGEETLEEC